MIIPWQELEAETLDNIVEKRKFYAKGPITV